MTDRMRTNAQERAHVKMMIELDRMERDIADARLRAGADPERLGRAGRDGAGAAAQEEGDGGARRGRGALVQAPRRGVSRPDQRGAAHLHAGADLEGGAERGRQGPARGRDLGEGAAEARRRNEERDPVGTAVERLRTGRATRRVAPGHRPERDGRRRGGRASAPIRPTRRTPASGPVLSGRPHRGVAAFPA